MFYNFKLPVCQDSQMYALLSILCHFTTSQGKSVIWVACPESIVWSWKLDTFIHRSWRKLTTSSLLLGMFSTSSRPAQQPACGFYFVDSFWNVYYNLKKKKSYLCSTMVQKLVKLCNRMVWCSNIRLSCSFSTWSLFPCLFLFICLHW